MKISSLVDLITSLPLSIKQKIFLFMSHPLSDIMKTFEAERYIVYIRVFQITYIKLTTIYNFPTNHTINNFSYKSHHDPKYMKNIEEEI
jgi:hypothetical protein